jgi:hypothetical protein
MGGRLEGYWPWWTMPLAAASQLGAPERSVLLVAPGEMRSRPAISGRYDCRNQAALTISVPEGSVPGMRRNL